MRHALLTCTLLAACGSRTPPAAPTPVPAPTLRFMDAGVPSADDQDVGVRTSPAWTLGELRGEVRLQRLLGSGQVLGGHTFGALVDLAGAPLPDLSGTTPWLPPGVDFAGMLEVDGRLLLTSHVEARPAALYVSTLELATDGTLTATATQAADLSAIRGTKDLCAGMITPWNTHLGGEEYELDAERMRSGGRYDNPQSSYDHEDEAMVRLFGEGGGPLWPYDYGYVPELTVAADGRTTATKHVTMGRFSHELATVLSDQRTVYMTDDNSDRGGLFLFIADTPGDLSAGHLYAARWTPTPDLNGPLGWVPLGHASAADLAGVMASRSLVYDAVFHHAPPSDTGTCPEGLTRVQHARGDTCLAVRQGMDQVASRLETRRYAGLKGATLEFTKGEGLAWDPDQQTVWLALSTVGRSMTDDEGDVRVSEVPCGAIMGLEGLSAGVLDTQGQPMPSALVATSLAAHLLGRASPDDPANACDVDGIANPDNIAYLPGHHLLTIAEDTGAHRFPTLWAWDTRSGELTRMATAPWCGEWTGIAWYPDLGGHGWLSVSMQHAYAYKSCKAPAGVEVPADPADRTWTGVFGPFPPLDR